MQGTCKNTLDILNGEVSNRSLRKRSLLAKIAKLILRTPLWARRYNPVGTALFAFAVSWSREKGFQGRVSLHAVDAAATSFYRRMEEKLGGGLPRIPFVATILSEVTQLTQKLADYAGYDVVYGPNPNFADLRSLSSEVTRFTKLTSEPFEVGGFTIPARFESDPVEIVNDVNKSRYETDQIARVVVLLGRSWKH